MAPPLPPAPVGIRLANAATPDIVVEMFHDVCCPFSKKMYDTVYGAVIPTLEGGNHAGQVEFLWQSVPQPWHGQSCFMHDAVMAASLLDAAKTGDYLMAMFTRQTDFFDDNTKDRTRVEIYRALADLGPEAGYDADAIAGTLSLDGVAGNGGLDGVTQQLKWAVKYHRTRGVHVTPTVFINGTEAPDVSSGWSADDWLDKLTPMLD